MLASSERGQRLLLDVCPAKNFRLLSYVGSFLLFPLLASLLVGLIGHNAILGVKIFLLIELGMAILSPLFIAVIPSGGRKPQHRGRTP
jgi:hypothetical protein